MNGNKLAAGVLTIGAMGAILGGISVPTAHADGDLHRSYSVWTGNRAGSASFAEYGDHLTVNDWAADGHGVQATIMDGTWIVREAYNGKGYHAGPVRKNYNLPENKKYTLWVCLVDGPNDQSIGGDCDSTTIYS